MFNVHGKNVVVNAWLIDWFRLVEFRDRESMEYALKELDDKK